MLPWITPEVYSICRRLQLLIRKIQFETISFDLQFINAGIEYYSTNMKFGGTL